MPSNSHCERNLRLASECELAECKYNDDGRNFKDLKTYLIDLWLDHASKINYLVTIRD